jgi:hypothetical protein
MVLTLLKLHVLALDRPGGDEGGPAEIPRITAVDLPRTNVFAEEPRTMKSQFPTYT